MKYLALLLALGLIGCAPVPTLEELEQQAFLTGDWSEVEEREKILARRAARKGMNCPSGYVSYCQRFAAQNRCSCVPRDKLFDAFAMR